MNRSEIAVNKFKEGYCCAQSVLYSYAEQLGISEDLALRLANGFGAGMGRWQEVCGAVSGAIIVLGLIYGRGASDGKDKHEYTYLKVRELIEKFEAQYGSVICKNLLDGCDLNTPAGQNHFKSKNMIEQCYGYVDSVVKILEEITA
jgi:C_GCAxxG_C_C family probable redox protein